MPSPRQIALGGLPILTSLVGVQAQQLLQVVWSDSSFVTAPGTAGGPEVGHDSGFAITDNEGHEFFYVQYPGGGSPCAGGEGIYHTIESTCWARPRTFWCSTTTGGDPQACEVQDHIDGMVEGGGAGTTSFTFTGISLSKQSYCGASFSLDEEESCDANAEFTVTENQVGN